MKTQIIRLDSFDDIVSIRDKITVSRGARMLLLFPRRRPPLLTRLDLTLLQRAVQAQGAGLGLVTISEAIQIEALPLGIPVFASVPAAIKASWGRPPLRTAAYQRKRQAGELAALRMSSGEQSVQLPPAVRVGIFFLAIAACTALAVFLLPSAVVHISPERSVQRLELELIANPQLKNVLPSGEIPLSTDRVVVSGAWIGEPSGTSAIAAASARGTLSVTNLTESAVTVAAGTLFRALDGQQYAAVRSVQVPAGVGKTGSVMVEAVIPGTPGNTPADSVVSVEGPVGLSVSVTNPTAITGGTDQRAKTVSAADYRQVKDQLLNQLSEQALIELKNQAEEAYILIDSSLKAGEIGTEVVSPPIGAAADQFSVELEVTYSIARVEVEDLKTAVRTGLDANLSPTAATIDDQIEIELGAAVDDGEQYRIPVHAERVIVPQIDPGSIAADLVGLPGAAAQTQIGQQLDLAEPAAIELRPGWWPRLPLFAARIAVAVE